MKILAINAAGERQYIPEHWLDHPVLGKDFTRIKETKTTAEPSKRAAAVKKEKTDA